ncbi:hypothetical protein L1887_42574 [Cichorium endivia]|nr:hypothetical protein L1887_42574 [Cichorium endivia]
MAVPHQGVRHRPPYGGRAIFSRRRSHLWPTVRLGREETLLVAVQAVHAALDLGRGGAQLEAHLARADGGAEQVEVRHTHILERVLQARVEVRQELLHRALVLHGARHALSHLDGVALGKVALRRGVLVGGELVRLGSALARGASDLALLLVLHGLDGAHATVALEALAVAVEVVAGRLGGAGKQTAHHDGAGTERERLGNVAHVRDAAVGNDGHAELGGELGDGVHGGTLGTADGHDLLGDADGAGAHADTQSVGTRSDEAGRLLTRHNVAGDDVNVREGGLDPLDHLDLVHRVALRRVEDDHIQAGLDEQRETLAVRGTRADGGGAVELLAVRALACEREVLVLEQVGAGEQRDEAALGIDNGQLALLAVAQDGVGLLERDALRGGDENCGQLACPDKSAKAAQRSGEGIRIGRFGGKGGGTEGRKLTSDGDAAEAEALLDLEDVADGGVGVEAEGLGDEAVLVLLDLADDASLLLRAHVVVDDTHAAHEAHCDGHLGLGDRVHGRREEGGVQRDVFGDLGAQADVRGGEVDEAGQHEEVVVGETAVLARVDELGHAETIAGGVGLEVLERLGRRQDRHVLGNLKTVTVACRHCRLS